MKKFPREAARELALLGISQLPTKPKRLQAQKLEEIVLTAVRTLISEVEEVLETAGAELQRGGDRLLSSKINASEIESSRAMAYEAIELGAKAIDLIGTAVELPELIQLSRQVEVRDYAVEILTEVNNNKLEIDELLDRSMVDWQMDRLPEIDRGILRIAIAEILFLSIPEKIAIDQAVELAKRYSGEEGYRFLNGVLRRVVERMKSEVRE